MWNKINRNPWVREYNLTVFKQVNKYQKTIHPGIKKIRRRKTK